MIAIIDYGMGNLRSVQKAFESVGHSAVVTRDRRAVLEASHVVLPGVGAFADCMATLNALGLVEPIRQTITQGKPFLGICLGLQVLFTESEEFGIHKGLDIIPGRVKRFPWGLAPSTQGGECSVPVPLTTGTDSTLRRGEGGQSPLKVPHMGWNALAVERSAPPLHGIEPGTHVYFVHSYYVEPADRSVVSTVTDYGIPFASSIWRDNVFACQFHPEKSQTAGLAIIKNFGDWR
jgi:glutamine amidotransferase